MSAATATVSEIVAYAFEHGATRATSHRPGTFSDTATWKIVDGVPVQEPLRREKCDMGREVVQISFRGKSAVEVTVDDTGRVLAVWSGLYGVTPWKQHAQPQWRKAIEEQGAAT